MAKKRIKRKRRKSNRKINANSAHASLCALAPLITGRKIFDYIHQSVKIPQKKVDYPRVRGDPSDKLVFVVLGIMSGCESVFDMNRELRVDRALLRAFGYQKCADQSVIQDTLNAAVGENVQELADLIEKKIKAQLEGEDVELFVNDAHVPINPFIRDLLLRILVAMVSSLKGVKEIRSLRISLRRKP